MAAERGFAMYFHLMFPMQPCLVFKKLYFKANLSKNKWIYIKELKKLSTNLFFFLKNLVQSLRFFELEREEDGLGVNAEKSKVKFSSIEALCDVVIGMWSLQKWCWQ